MDKTIRLSGAMRSSLALVRDALAEIESAQALERGDFAQLVAGTALSCDSLLEKVMDKDWYLFADEALRIGLIAQIVM